MILPDRLGKALACVTVAGLVAIPTPSLARDEAGWRRLDPANVAYLELPDGEVVIELNPAFAPKTVAQFKRLVAGGFYDGLAFYRVIDGFVAQAGDGSDMAETPNAVPALPPEFERAWSEDLPFVSVQKPDMFAPETGFIDGFAAARDLAQGNVWLTHCPGVVAMARNNEPDTGSTDFYIVIGQAPRYLDRNLTIFGRVVDGMEVIQRVHRGPPEASGMIPEGAPRTEIVRASLGKEMPPAERALEVEDTNSEAFRAVLRSRRERGKPFFHHKPPEVLDVCQIPIATR
ncbi:MAG TPA: peptidylprolyl isomerase [Woeseiaceae bacterium]|nr:peptidylprolyl isomerase [Woeseiaceae bacterium]